MGKELGLEFTPEMVPVDFLVNGEYMGSYTVSEEVRIGNNRVDIGEIDPSATDGDEITGGYLLALRPYFDEPEENKFMTARGIEFLMDGPVFDSSDPDEQAAQEQYDYITSYLQRTENAIFGDGCKDENGVSYAEYMDIDSAARYWWVQQLSKNTDAFMTPSTYLYKERDGKLYWGPLWDFDNSMLDIPEEGGNPFNDKNKNMAWLDHLRENDPQFQEALRRTWKEFEPVIDDVTRSGGLLDQYRDELRPSWQDNFDRWFAENSGISVDFDEETESIRNFLKTMKSRFADNIDELLTKVNCTITFMDGDQLLSTKTVRSGSFLTYFLEDANPEKEGYQFRGWLTEDGAQVDPDAYVNTDLILKADFAKNEDDPGDGPEHGKQPWDHLIIVTPDDPEQPETTENGRAHTDPHPDGDGYDWDDSLSEVRNRMAGEDWIVYSPADWTYSLSADKTFLVYVHTDASTLLSVILDARPLTADSKAFEVIGEDKDITLLVFSEEFMQGLEAGEHTFTFKLSGIGKVVRTLRVVK